MTPRIKWILGIVALAIVAVSFIPLGEKHSPGTREELPLPQSNRITIARAMEYFVPPPKPLSVLISNAPSTTAATPKAVVVEPVVREIPVLSVHFDVTEPAPPGPSAPTGRMIRCRLVNSLETIRIETPIVGIVTHDLWFNGELVVPAETEVLGRAQIDRTRNRISGHPDWRLVFRDGRELAFKGILLNREANPSDNTWGPNDGTAGIEGQLVRSDNYEKVMLFLTSAASGFAQSFQTRNTTVWGTSSPTASVGNAGLNAGANVMEAYAKEVWETIQRDGVYVHVPGGSEFYIFASEPIDLAKASTRGTLNTQK